MCVYRERDVFSLMTSFTKVVSDGRLIEVLGEELAPVPVCPM
jgi:hypothetical protein